MSGDLSHHAFDISCMLSLYQLRLVTSAAAYIVFGHVTCDACWDTHTPPPVDRMTNVCKNITFPQTYFSGSKNVYFFSAGLRVQISGLWKLPYLYLSTNV